MKKYLLILVLALIGFSCSQENEFDGNNSVQNGFQVNSEFIDLSVGGGNQQAGMIKVNSNEDEVKIKWISDPSFNIDTTQTSLSMKNGQGVLPIKWQRKQENGTYAPSNILFKAGVVITSGEEEKFIPLYHVQNLDSAKVAENIRTRAGEEGDPRFSSIEFIPGNPVMGENGTVLLVKLTNVEQAVVDYSNIRASHNIDINDTDLPTLLSGTQAVLKFKWKDASVRPAAFAIPVLFYAFELVNPVSFTLVWNPEEETLSVNPEKHDIAYTGGVVSSQITCNASWSVSKGLESWFKMTPTTGNGNGAIEFTVSENSGEARSATVTIIAGKVSKEIVINQAAKEDELVVDPITHSVTNAGGKVTSAITCNTDWTVTKGSESWFTMSPSTGTGNGTLTFTVDANTSLEARSAKVTVTAGSLTKEITISQAAQDIVLSVNPTNHLVNNAGGKVTSAITCNTDWTVTKGSESWFTMSPSTGTGNGTLTFTVAANTSVQPRSAKVTVKAGSLTKEITISQVAGEVSLTVSPTTHSLKKAGGVVTSAITCNTAWTATKGSESWFTINKTTGSGNGSISITVAANTGAARSATVTIQSGSVKRSVFIMQEADSTQPGPGNVTIEDWNNQTNQDVSGSEL